MRILVTGGAGYIGSHTAKALARAGYEPVVLDNFGTGYRSAVRWGPLVEGDLKDAGLISKVIKEYEVKAVIHFAASLLVGESMAQPQKYFWNNVVNTLKLLDAMLATSVKHIVFSSSAAVYGTPDKVPIPEDHPLRPINPYGETKLIMERALHWYSTAYGLRSAALRYFNAAGADPQGEIGEGHDPETHLIPLVIQATLGLIPFVEVYGTHYPTPDGTAIRDYIHVTDLAEAHVLALRYLMEGGTPVALNLGAGRGFSVREVIAAIERCSGGRKTPTRDAPRREGDPPSLVADPVRAAKLLGWRPQYSDLDTIVQTAWKWHAAREELHGHKVR
ncbi:MAG TPA: UDP-glucose 4-epimerase GalE [Terriglobia bacterium]|nr:UDP-glucose 4-epimerase GalE [Terriglobia bacterium]